MNTLTIIVIFILILANNIFIVRRRIKKTIEFGDWLIDNEFRKYPKKYYPKYAHNLWFSHKIKEYNRSTEQVYQIFNNKS